MKKRFLLLLLALALAVVSCKKKDAVEGSNTSVVIPTEDEITGLFILNEGNMTNANSSLSYYDIKADTVGNNMFYKINGSPIGDVGQSLAKIGKSMYIVVNNGRYIYKVNAETIEYQDQITGFSSPRYMLSLGKNKVYVSDLGSPGFWVLNLNTMDKRLVETGKSTECMVKIGKEVFVSNWSQVYISAANNTIQVIDCETDRLVDEITVAQEPKAMVVDKHNKLWVICNGGWDPMALQNPALICINPATREIIKRFDFVPGVDSPDGLAIDGAGENIFFMNGVYGTLNVYKMSVDADEVPDTPFITSNGRRFYNLKVNPQNGDIYLTDAKDYVSNGDLLRYNADGDLVCVHPLGIIPSYMLFN